MQRSFGGGAHTGAALTRGRRSHGGGAHTSKYGIEIINHHFARRMQVKTEKLVKQDFHKRSYILTWKSKLFYSFQRLAVKNYYLKEW